MLKSCFPYLLVFVSGFTGLVYEVTWQKYLTFYLGSHAFATALVLAVFFLSLSLGYFVIGNRSHTWIKNKLFLYGIIEGLIGAYCLLSPEIFHFLEGVFPTSFDSRSSQILMGFAFTAAFIGPPTFLMGGTIPVLTQALTSHFENSHRVHALVYGLNTFGAFAGTLMAGFVFTEIWGLPLTLIYTSLFNLLIALITYIMFKMDPDGYSGVELSSSNSEDAEGVVRGRALLYGISFTSGFYVFSLETVIIRMAGVSVGAQSYTFAMIVAAFILAIALGSFAVSILKRIGGLQVFWYVQLALIFTTVLLFLSIPHWPYLMTWIKHVISPSVSAWPVFWTVITLSFILILLIPVGLMGMNIPLLFHYLKSKKLALSSVVGRIYAINSIGSALGATVGGYLLFYVLTGAGIFKLNLFLMTLVLMGVGLLVFANTQQRLIKTAFTVIILSVIFLLPSWNEGNFTPGIEGSALNRQMSFSEQIRGIRERNPVTFSAQGPDAMVGVVPQGKGKVLYVNGNPNVGPSDVFVRSLNALIPLALHPRPEKAFVIGLGSGLSGAIIASEPSLQMLKIAEISKSVIDALPEFKHENQGLYDHMDKVELIHADAFQALKASPHRFSMIVCEPAHPWISGVENLYTQEFLTAVRDRLSDDGLFTQWMPLFSADQKAVMAVLNTFKSVFPWVTVWSPANGVFAMVGGKQAPILSAKRLLQATQVHAATFKKLGLSSAQSVLGFQLLTEDGVKRLLEKVQGIHSLEFPIMGSAYSKSRYIGLNVSPRNLLIDGVVTLPKADDPFFYEMLHQANSLPESFFTDLLAEKPITMMTPSQEDRIRFHYQLYYPQNKLSKIGERPFKAMRYMISADPSKKELTKSKYTPKEISDLFDTFKMLMAAQLPVKWKAMTNLLPAACEDDFCSQMKALLITGLEGGESTRLKDLPKDGKQRKLDLDQIFLELTSSL